MAGRLPAGAREVGMARGEGPRRALPVDEAALRRAVGEDERLLLHQVVADLVVDLDVGVEYFLRRLADAVDDQVAVGHRVVGGAVVVGPVALPERLLAVEPRLPAPR